MKKKRLFIGVAVCSNWSRYKSVSCERIVPVTNEPTDDDDEHV